MASFGPVGPFGQVWPHTALFGHFWPRLTPFGPVWHHLAPRGPAQPNLALIDRSSILISRYFKVQIPQGDMDPFHNSIQNKDTIHVLNKSDVKLLKSSKYITEGEP